MALERCRDVAHVSAVQLRTQVPEQTVNFFVRLMGLTEVAREGTSSYLRTWDDYEQFTISVTAAAAAGIGRTWLRASGPDALARRVSAIKATGYGIGWTDGEQGIGPTYLFTDPDGHEFGIYWESEWYDPPEGQRPALKNQAAPFPGRGASVRRLDHVNYLAADIPAITRFVPDALGARLTEQIVLDDGAPSAVWYHVADKSYDLVYTSDWTGSAGGCTTSRSRPTSARTSSGPPTSCSKPGSTSRPDRTSTPSSRRSSCTCGSQAATASSCATRVPGWCSPRTGGPSHGRPPSGPTARPGA